MKKILRVLGAVAAHIGAKTELCVSSDLLARFFHKSKKFLLHLIIVKETWAHHYTPESKEQSK